MTETRSLTSHAPWMVPDSHTMLYADTENSLIARPDAVAPTYVTDSAQWDAMRAVLKQLYIIEGRELKDVMLIMQNQHDFVGTLQQYKKRFKKWGFRKYNCEDEVRALLLAEPQHHETNLLYRSKNSGRRVNMANVRRYARRRGLCASNIVPSHHGLDRCQPGDDASLQSISQLTTVKIPHQELEIVLRAVQAYISGGIESGVWHSSGPRSYLRSSKQCGSSIDSSQLRWDIISALSALYGGQIKAGLTLVSRFCHNAKFVLQSEDFRTISMLLTVAKLLADYDNVLAIKVMKHVSCLSRSLYGNQHPLSIVTIYLASGGAQIYDEEFPECLCELLLGVTQESLGRIHVDTIYLMDELLSGTLQTEKQLKDSLGACDASYGPMNPLSRLCLSRLGANAIIRNDIEGARSVGSEMQRRLSLESSAESSTLWSLHTSQAALDLARVEKKWQWAETILREQLIPFHDVEFSEQTGDAILYRLELIRVLEQQERWEEVAEIRLEIDEITASISEEIEL